MSGPGDLPGWDLPDLGSVPPPPILPEPATHRPDQLRGVRAVVGLPGLGWRTDLRADSPVVQSSRTYVPVLTEAEWYRAEAEQTEVFAPLIPIERVWVERPAPDAPRTVHPLDLIGRLVSLDAPPRRDPVPIGQVIGVTGRRVVHNEDGMFRRDLRAVTEPFTGSDGDICVRVAREFEWYRWAWTGRVPQTLELPVHLLWLE